MTDSEETEGSLIDDLVANPLGTVKVETNLGDFDLGLSSEHTQRSSADDLYPPEELFGDNEAFSPNKRPWSKKATIFKHSPRLVFGRVLLLLGLLPWALWPLADKLDLTFDSPLGDKCWNMLNSKFNLPNGFLQTHRNLDMIDRCDERLLPRWPVSPGPLAHSSAGLLKRPARIIDQSDLWNVDGPIYDRVASLNLPNYRGARINLNPNFKRQVWEDLLIDYEDSQVIDFMDFGWPSSYESNLKPVIGLPNHSSSKQSPEAVAKYFDKELKESALVGPFDKSPFEWTRTNPLMVRPKKEPGKFRVILDLSFPLCESVNSFIPSLSYDGAPYKLRFIYLFILFTVIYIAHFP